MKLYLLLASLTCIGLSVGALAEPEKSTSPTIVATSSSLVEVGDDGTSPPSVFDMGALEQLDHTQANSDFREENKFLPWQAGYKRILPGNKHIFQLKNIGSRDITLSFLENSSFCVQSEIVQDHKRADIRVIKPGETAGVLVAFNQYLASPGPVREQVKVLGKDFRQSVVTLVIQGRVKTSIEFVEPSIDFGKGNVNEQSRIFTLTFDKRVPSQMMPTPLKLISSNSNVTIQSLDEGKEIMGVKVQKDQLTIPIDKPLPKELRLRFRATLNKQAPPGAIEGRIKLVMVGAPMAAVVRNLSIPLKGEVTSEK